MTAKQRVLSRCPTAYCVRLDPAAKSLVASGHRFIVWPGKINARGFLNAACGLGSSAAKAWASVQFNQ